MALTKVTGELVDIGDLDISNVGSIQLDSIAGDADTNTTIAFPGSDVITMSTGGSERLRVDASGRLLIGYGTSTHVRAVEGAIQVQGTNLDTSSINAVRYSADAYAPILSFGKSRNASAGGQTIVQDGDACGTIAFAGSDGTDLENRVAQIVAQVDGTPGSNDMPGRLIFETTADGAAASTERMRITSAGKVGIGTTSPSTKLHLEDSSADSIVQLTWKNDARDWRLGVHGGVSDSLVLYDNTASATRMVVDSSGKFGIGTTSPASLIDIIGSTGDQIRIQSSKSDNTAKTAGIVSTMYTNNTVSIWHGSFANGNNTIFYGSNDTNHRGIQNHVFYVNAGYNATSAHAEAMRITSSKQVFINDDTFGGSAAQFAVKVPASGAGCLIKVSSTADANETMLQFQDGSGQGQGSITSNPSANTTAYGTSSDYRLKENISYTWDATTRLKQLKPARFNWKRQDASKVHDGFLAHEVSAIVPSAIVGAKDAKDSDDNPIYQQIDHSKLVPLLVKTIQELEARIATLEG